MTLTKSIVFKIRGPIYLLSLFVGLFFINPILVGPTEARGPIHGVVVNVKDGDTVTVWEDEKLYPVRLYGIDAPQKDQGCWQEAKLFISRMVFNKDLVVTPMGIHSDGSILGIIYIKQACVNEALVKNGLAWVADSSCLDLLCEQWKHHQNHARKNKIGLWRNPAPVPPWKF